DGPTNVIGRLLSSADELDAIGHVLLTGGAQRARVSNTESSAVSEAAPATQPASEFERLTRSLLARALANPPPDIGLLRNANLPAMGNLAGRMQASLLLLAVAEVLMNARSAAVMAPHTLVSTVASLAA